MCRLLKRKYCRFLMKKSMCICCRYCCLLFIEVTWCKEFKNYKKNSPDTAPVINAEFYMYAYFHYWSMLANTFRHWFSILTLICSFKNFFFLFYLCLFLFSSSLCYGLRRNKILTSLSSQGTVIKTVPLFSKKKKFFASLYVSLNASIDYNFQHLRFSKLTNALQTVMASNIPL